MPSPLLHSAAGLAICLLDRDTFRKLRWRFAAIMVAAAVAPDFDIIPGLLINDANRFHRFWSHSIGAAVLVGALTMLFLRGTNWRLGLLVTAAFCSHLALDLFCVDARLVNGIPLLWPLSATQVIGPPLLGAFEHGGDGESPLGFLRNVLNPVNLAVLRVESVVAAAALAICACLGWFIDSKRSRG